MKTTNRTMVGFGAFLIAFAFAFLVKFCKQMMTITYPFADMDFVLFCLVLITAIIGTTFISLGFYIRKYKKYWSIENMKDKTDFSILHMGVIDKDHPDILRMGISIEGDYFLFQASIKDFGNKKPTVWSKYTKRGTLFE